MKKKHNNKERGRPAEREHKKYKKNDAARYGEEINKKRKVKDLIFLMITIIGLLFLCYPFYTDYQLNQLQKAEINSYKIISKRATSEEKENIKKKINENQEKHIEVEDPFSTSSFDLKQSKLPAVSGILSIPTINLDSPIYPTTTNLVLESGIGTLEGTSLPNGETNNHTVLTSHSGLSLGKMFTDLPKLKIGDHFYIEILDQVYAYEVDQIKTVLPDDLSHFEREKEKDFVTLLTCTPLGINSHRLLVRGHRIPYDKKEKAAIRKYFWTIQNILLILLLGLFIVATILVVWRNFKRMKRKIRENY